MKYQIKDYRTSIKSDFKFNIKRTYLDLYRDNIPEEFDSLKIVALTDFHYGCYTNPKIIESAISMTNEEKSDFVFFLGDFIHSGRENFKLAICKLLGIRRSKYRTYRRRALKYAKQLSEQLKKVESTNDILSVWGNHDYTEGIWVLKSILPKNIKILVNQTSVISLEKNGQKLNLGVYGTDDWRKGKIDFNNLYNSEDFNNSDIKVLLSHNPDFILSPEANKISDIDLILSGHTHGGQICLPGEIPLVTESKQINHWKGLSFYKNIPFYVANGIGCSGLPLRLNCHPEMLIITFRKQE